jgi:hypothetical protein
MARKVCTTTQGLSVCCQAAQAGLLGRPVTFTTRSGAQRCGVCSTHPSTSTNPKKRGRTVFQFRFTSNANCGITSGCPYLPGAMGGTTGGMLPMQGGTFLPSPGTLMIPQLP